MALEQLTIPDNLLNKINDIQLVDIVGTKLKDLEPNAKLKVEHFLCDFNLYYVVSFGHVDYFHLETFINNLMDKDRNCRKQLYNSFYESRICNDIGFATGSGVISGKTYGILITNCGWDMKDTMKNMIKSHVFGKVLWGISSVD